MTTTYTQPVLNSRLLQERRLALGLSLAQMANRIGISSPSLALLERGRGHGDTTLATACRIARELNTTLASLVEQEDPPQPPADDDRRVEAAIHEAGRQLWLADLCQALDMCRPRVQAALGTLERRLEGTGTFLRRSGAAYSFGPRDGILSTADREGLARVRRSRSEIDIGEARMLRRAMLGQLDDAYLHRKLGGPGRAAIGALLTHRLLESGPDVQLTLSDAVAFSLGERTRPPAPLQSRSRRSTR
jgi:transcriptional regulator with XRE-family HTH domain